MALKPYRLMSPLDAVGEANPEIGELYIDLTRTVRSQYFSIRLPVLDLPVEGRGNPANVAWHSMLVEPDSKFELITGVVRYMDVVGSHPLALGEPVDDRVPVRLAVLQEAGELNLDVEPGIGYLLINDELAAEHHVCQQFVRAVAVVRVPGEGERQRDPAERRSRNHDFALVHGSVDGSGWVLTTKCQAGGIRSSVIVEQARV
jgi:hypothetical protein